jgi:hypothetical protein
LWTTGEWRLARFMHISKAAGDVCSRMDRRVHPALRIGLKHEDLMIKVATIFSAQLAAAAVVLTIGGAAFARDLAPVGSSQTAEIGCVNGVPAPPWTQICPPTDVNKSFAQASAGRSGSCAQKYRSFDAASGTFLGRDGLRHACR